jgi:hypothetical protein
MEFSLVCCQFFGAELHDVTGMLPSPAAILPAAGLGRHWAFFCLVVAEVAACQGNEHVLQAHMPRREANQGPPSLVELVEQGGDRTMRLRDCQ